MYTKCMKFELSHRAVNETLNETCVAAIDKTNKVAPNYKSTWFFITGHIFNELLLLKYTQLRSD